MIYDSGDSNPKVILILETETIFIDPPIYTEHGSKSVINKASTALVRYNSGYGKCAGRRRLQKNGFDDDDDYPYPAPAESSKQQTYLTNPQPVGFFFCCLNE